MAEFVSYVTIRQEVETLEDADANLADALDQPWIEGLSWTTVPAADVGPVSGKEVCDG